MDWPSYLGIIVAILVGVGIPLYTTIGRLQASMGAMRKSFDSMEKSVDGRLAMVYKEMGKLKRRQIRTNKKITRIDAYLIAKDDGRAKDVLRGDDNNE